MAFRSMHMAFNVRLTVEVLFPYDAQLDDELSIQPGDEIEVSTEEWKSDQEWIRGSKVSAKSVSAKKYFFKAFTEEMQLKIPIVPIVSIQEKGSIEITFQEKVYQLAEKSIEDWLECVICVTLSEEPQLTECCVKTMCLTCIQKCKKQNDSCPCCRQKGFQVHADIRAKLQILTLMTHCPKERCGWKGYLKDVNLHLRDQCQFQGVLCDLCKNVTVLRSELQDHIKNECQERRLPCPRCYEAIASYSIPDRNDESSNPTQGFIPHFLKFLTTSSSEYTYSELAKNHYKRCPYWPIRCPNKCNPQLTLPRKEVEHHLINVCPEQEISCQFRSLGCKQENVKRSDMSQHLDNNVSDHLSLLLTDHARMMTELSQLKHEVYFLKGENRKLKSPFQYR